MGGDVIAIIIVTVLALIIKFSGNLIKTRFGDAKVHPWFNFWQNSLFQFFAAKNRFMIIEVEFECVE